MLPLSMSRQIVLLRGVNLGPNRRVAMPRLREMLTEAGLRDVRTYVQSGNVVLESEDPPTALAERCERLLAEGFGLQVPVIVRTREELERVVGADPLGDVAADHKRYLVSFLAEPLEPSAVSALSELAVPGERLVALEREIYSWHPSGVARSKLWSRMAGRELGVTATARNWTTVATLLQIAREGENVADDR